MDTSYMDDRLLFSMAENAMNHCNSPRGQSDQCDILFISISSDIWQQDWRCVHYGRSIKVMCYPERIWFLCKRTLWNNQPYRAPNLMWRLPLFDNQLFVTSNLMGHPTLCCIQRYVTSNFMWHPILFDIQSYLTANLVWHLILCDIQSHVTSNLMWHPPLT